MDEGFSGSVGAGVTVATAVVVAEPRRPGVLTVNVGFFSVMRALEVPAEEMCSW